LFVGVVGLIDDSEPTETFLEDVGEIFFLLEGDLAFFGDLDEDVVDEEVDEDDELVLSPFIWLCFCPWINATCILGRTPDEGNVQFSRSFASSSSDLTASCKSLGMIRFLLASRVAFPPSSNTSAERYSRTAARNIGAP